MKKKFLLGMCVFVFTFFSAGIFANQNVFPISLVTKATKQCSVASDIIPQFCAKSGQGSFRAAVQGCCPLGPIPMGKIYGLMIATYGNLQAACRANAAQYGGTVAACIGQWTCYWHGGNSQDMNGLCDGNGQACGSL